MAIQKIELVLPFPPSANTAYPTNAHGRHLSKRGREFKDEAGKLALVVLRGIDIVDTTQLHIDIGLFFPNHRKSDVDNYIKLPKDLLCEILHIDDDWSRIPRVSAEYRGVDKSNPRCVVELTIL